MRTIIAGSRNIWSYNVVRNTIEESEFDITTVISGCADGVDWLGEKWAGEMGIDLIKFPANWNKYKKAAGPIRNEKMAKEADACIVIYDGKSKGSSDMIERAKKHNLKLFIKVII